MRVVAVLALIVAVVLVEQWLIHPDTDLHIQRGSIQHGRR